MSVFACHTVVISGYIDGTFRPGSDVTRGQLCKIVVLAEGWQVECPEVGHFVDVPAGSAFYCYIETAYNMGIISGYADGTFRPGNNAVRGQLSKIVYEAITASQSSSSPEDKTDATPEEPGKDQAAPAPEAGAPHGHSRGAARRAARPSPKRACHCPPGCGDRSKDVTHSPSRFSIASVSVGSWMRPTVKVPAQTAVVPV